MAPPFARYVKPAVSPTVLTTSLSLKIAAFLKVIVPSLLMAPPCAPLPAIVLLATFESNVTPSLNVISP